MALGPGQLRAPDLRDALFAVGYLASDAVLSSSVAPIEAPGLAAPLEPRSFYAIDGYVAVNSTVFTKLSLDVPAGADGHWGLLGADDVTNIGTAVSAYTGFGFTHAVSISGAATPSACVIRGYVTTVPGGALRLLFAQYASDPSQTAVKAGSWLRLSKLA